MPHTHYISHSTISEKLKIKVDFLKTHTHTQSKTNARYLLDELFHILVSMTCHNKYSAFTLSSIAEHRRANSDMSP